MALRLSNNVAEHLTKNGIQAMALHGNKSQTARTQALAGFKNGDIRALVATDIAARGIDIDELPHVVNYEIPNVSEDYVHRIWGGLGKPPSRDVMQAAAKAARSEMMTRIRDTKGAQPARGGNAGAGGRGPRAPAGHSAGAGRGGNGGGGNGSYGGGGGNGGGGFGGNTDRRGPAQPRQNSGYPQAGGQPSFSQPRNSHAPAPRQRDHEPRNDFDNQQPASHASSGFPSSGQPTGNRGNFRGGNRSGGGGGGAGGPGRSNNNGPRRSGGPGSFSGR